MCLLVKNSKELLRFFSLYLALGTPAFVLPKVPSHYQTKLANKIPQGVKEFWVLWFFCVLFWLFFSGDGSSAEPDPYQNGSCRFLGMGEEQQVKSLCSSFWHLFTRQRKYGETTWNPGLNGIMAVQIISYEDCIIKKYSTIYIPQRTTIAMKHSRIWRSSDPMFHLRKKVHSFYLLTSTYYAIKSELLSQIGSQQLR